ncbi:MAG: efflux RND transporter periplasmic adaptor subunit [Pelosinus sp.]|nr:efflux RND transporter periplasmic adaptor subunit [Pelosinus sp.]
MKKIKIPTWRSVLSTVVFLIAAISVSNYSGLTQTLFPESSVTVTAMPVSTLSKPVQLVLSGAVEGANSAVITAEISGQITEVNVKEGQTVTPGQSLIKIQGTSTNTVQAQPVPQIIPVQPNPEIIAEAEANYNALAKQFDRYQKLLDQGAIARRQVDDLALRLDAAKEALENAKSTADMPPAAASTPSEAAVQNSLANLTSAVPGVVRSLTAAPGAAVQTGQPLLVVDSGSDVQVSVQLAQKDLYAVHSGTPVEIFLNESPEQIIAGQIQGIFPQAGPAGTFFRTQIRIDNSAILLKSGMTVKVRINTPNSAPVQAVPVTAIRQDQSEDYIYIAVNGKAVRQPVTIGDKIGEFAEITSSLPEGASVIITNLNTLKDGTEITLQ